MKKMNFKFYILIAILFAVNPGLILAEELVPVEPEIIPTEEIATDEDISTNTEEVASSTTDILAASTTTEETPESFSPASFSLENSNETISTITVNLNVRYQDSLVFSGPITLIKDATTTVFDNTNTNR